MVELWNKGLIWDTMIGTALIPLDTIRQSDEVTHIQHNHHNHQLVFLSESTVFRCTKLPLCFFLLEGFLHGQYEQPITVSMYNWAPDYYFFIVYKADDLHESSPVPPWNRNIVVLWISCSWIMWSVNNQTDAVIGQFGYGCIYTNWKTAVMSLEFSHILPRCLPPFPALMSHQINGNVA